MPEFAPIDYSGAFANTPDPTQAFTQGLQSGLVTQQGLLQQQMQRAQFGRLQQMQQATMQVAQNPTPQSIAQLSIAFPEMSENFKRSFDMLTPAQQLARVNQASQVYAAAQNGRPDIAAQLLREQAQAAQNSGDAQGAQHQLRMAEWAETHPKSFTGMAGAILAAAMGPDKFGQTFRDIGSETRDQGLYPSKLQESQAGADIKTAEAAAAPAKIAADIADKNSVISQRAGQLALDRDKLASEQQLKRYELDLQYGTPAPEAAKLINEAATNGAAGEMSASRLNDLSERMEQMLKSRDSSWYGGKASGTAYDLFAKVSGGDASTALKQEYERITNNQALGQIKDALGGRVTDVDMKVALGSVPGPNASPEVVTSYLRGTAKLQQLQATMENAKAEWLAQAGHQGHLGPLKKDISIMGTQVPAGTTFADWSRQMLKTKADQLSAQSSLSRAAGRSYMRFADPNNSDSAPQQGAGQPATSAALTPAATQEPSFWDNLAQHPLVKHLVDLGVDYESPEGKKLLQARVAAARAGGPALSDVEQLRARQAGLLAP
jgi:hypothetical protein